MRSIWEFRAGRALLGIIFLASGFGKFAAFSTMAGMLAAKGAPAPGLMLGIAAVAEIAGGLGLVSGILDRWAALGLFVYLIPTTLMFHNFWAYQGMEQQMQLVNFLKNLAIMGGLLLVHNRGEATSTSEVAERLKAA